MVFDDHLLSFVYVRQFDWKLLFLSGF